MPRLHPTPGNTGPPRGPRVRIAIIVAMEREVAPLLESWRRQGKVAVIEIPGMMAGASAYQCGDVSLLCAGIGKRAGAAAAKAAVDALEPDVIVSAGLAGALKPEVKTGSAFRPSEIVNAATGERTVKGKTAASGVLITAASVLSREEKKALAQRFGADAVDMEAAVVADIAHAAGVRFLAVKAISDEVDFEMPPMDKFIDPEGRLDLLKLIGWALVRPRVWGPLAVLRRNTRIAAQALAKELEGLTAGEWQ